jgi:enterochelin esterase-like enzyme
MTLFRIVSLLLLIGLFAFALPLHAQDEPACSPTSGTVITRQIQSEAIAQEKSYNLYLPPNWCNLDNLPLLVMLHGYYGDNTDWVNQGHLDEAATGLILAGEIDPLIILMPDGDNSFYINGSQGDYETYIVTELVGTVDQDFPTAATRETRFIGGLSMGGYGALYLGLRYPEMFSAIGAHSPAILEPSNDPVSRYLYGVGGERLAERDVVSLVEKNGWPADTRFFIDIGNLDNLIGGVFRLISVMFDGVQLSDYQGHVWPGAHNWSYWSKHAPDYLRFYMGSE